MLDSILLKFLLRLFSEIGRAKSMAAIPLLIRLFLPPKLYITFIKTANANCSLCTNSQERYY